jgi:hypothetical protein
MGQSPLIVQDHKKGSHSLSMSSLSMYYRVGGMDTMILTVTAAVCVHASVSARCLRVDG